MTVDMLFGATQPIDKGAQEQSVFVEWMEQKGIMHQKCKICPCNRNGRGVKAAVSMKEGDVVLEVPDDAVLLSRTGCMQKRIEASGMEDDGEPVLQSVPLVVSTMAEKLMGADSPWSAYLSVLPPLQSMSLPFTWEEHMTADLVGTSVQLRQDCMYDQLPGEVDGLFEGLMMPFFEDIRAEGLITDASLHELFQWATSIVASYSFELGESKEPTPVPLKYLTLCYLGNGGNIREDAEDLLNHVTGRQNVRLNHCARRGCLQMIATRRIKKGEELINNYGPLSNGELLRRFGFVEPLSLFPDELERLCQRANAAERIQSAATNSHQLWMPPNKYDEAFLPLGVIEYLLQMRRHPPKLVSRKLAFAAECGIIPITERYRIDCHGNLDGAAAELFRILAMDTRSFDIFTKSVAAWQPGAPPPCADNCFQSMRREFEEQWTGLVVAALALLRLKMRPPSAIIEILKHGKPGHVQNAHQAAATVSLGEWVAVDSCMCRVSGMVMDGETGRQLFLEADSSLIPGQEDCSDDDLAIGGRWLLKLSKEWWASEGVKVLEGGEGMMDEE